MLPSLVTVILIGRWVFAAAGLRLIAALVGPAPLPTWEPRWSPWLIVVGVVWWNVRVG